MGKVNLPHANTDVKLQTAYQFPMGKVKMINSAFGVGGLRYQFPMGKVKLTVIFGRTTRNMYQFPIGKVKPRA